MIMERRVLYATIGMLGTLLLAVVIGKLIEGGPELDAEKLTALTEAVETTYAGELELTYDEKDGILQLHLVSGEAIDDLDRLLVNAGGYETWYALTLVANDVSK